MRIRNNKVVVAILAMMLVVGGIPGFLAPGGGKASAETTQIWSNLGDPGFSAGTASYTSMTIDPDGTPYMAYRDFSLGYKIAVNKYDGSHWVPVGTAGFSAGVASYISLKTDTDGIPYVAYQDGGNGYKATVMKYVGIDEAHPTGWAPVGNVGFSGSQADYLSLYVDDGIPYVAYKDVGNGNKATVMKYVGEDLAYPTGWAPVGNVGLSGLQADYLSLYVDDGIPYVAYKDGVFANRATVKKYDDATGWTDVGRAGFSALDANYISLYVENHIPYVAYQDGGNGNKATAMKYNGSSWAPVGSAGFSAGTVYSTSLYVDDDGTPYVAYEDVGNGNKATVMKYDGSSWVPVGSAGVSAGMASDTSMYVENGTPYVGYSDGENGGKATVMNFRTFNVSPVVTADTTENNATSAIELTFTDDMAWRNAITSVKDGDVTLTAGTDYTVSAGKITIHAGVLNAGFHIISISADGFTTASAVQIVGEWQQVGSAGFSAGSASYTSVAVDPDGTPYVAFSDGENSDKATVMKFNGSSWEPVGTAGFSAGQAADISVKTDTDGILYVAYQDERNYNSATVMKYDDATGWTAVGSAGFSDGQASYTSLYVYNSTPYVAYADWENDGKATVMKYDGSRWVSVGDPGFSAGEADYTSLYVDNGTPYIAYQDGGNGNKATVMKHDDTTGWTDVGIAGFSDGQASYTSLYVENGTPYVGYVDGGNDNKATVMKYDDTAGWTDVGSAGFTEEAAAYTSLYIDKNGTPYVAYAGDEEATDGKVAVMKYDDTTGWVPVGNLGISLGSAEYTSLYVYNGIPYVAYPDGGFDDKVAVMKIIGHNADLSGLTLSSGTLDPVFDSSTLSYTASVGNDAGSITVTPTVSDSNATVTVSVNDGTASSVANGQASGPLALNVGANTITLAVTAQDGSTAKTYTVAVTRAASSNADLSGLTLSSGTLDPVFDSGTLSYTASVGNDAGSITVTPTVSDSNATVTVSVNDGTASSIANGQASGPLALNVGANTITLAVTAQDGSTAKTYTVAVTRAASSNADLSGLTLSSGTLDPVFDSGTLSYTASVGNDAGSITVTPTVSDSNATVTVSVNDGTASSIANGQASSPLALNVGANTVTLVVTAQDGSTAKTYMVAVTRAASSDVDLAGLTGLTLSSGTLDPVFDSGTLSYTASVGNDADSITVTPTVSDSNATVTVNGQAATSGAPSDAINLNVGSNTITVVVTAQDGSTMKTYTVAVTRAASSNTELTGLTDLTLSNGTLDPVFDSGTLSYTASVGNDADSITVTPTVSDSNATVTVNGQVATSGAPSDAINLNVGSNTVTLVVTAADGSTTKTYTVTVTRAASSDVDLAGLTGLALSSGTLDPVFDSGTLSYTASVGNDADSITVTPIVSDSNATVTVSVNDGTASSVANGQASGPLALNVGANTVTLVVTAADGSTTKTYTVAVTRAASSSADLTGLALSSGTLDPVFDSGTLSYTASVSNDAGSITVTPTVSDSNATVTVSVNDGTASSVAYGQASGPLALNVGTNTIKITVTAQDGTTKSTYTVTLTRASSAPSGSGAPVVPTTDQTKSNDLSLTIDGKTVESIATATSSEEDDQTVLTATIDSAKLAEQLAGAEDNSIVTIPVTAKADKVSAVLSGDAIQTMGDKDAVLDIQTQIGGYKLPASEVKIGLLTALLGGQESDADQVSVHVDIAKSDDAKVGLLWDAANVGGFTVVVPPVDFTVTATLGDKSVTVDTFSSYVEREIPIPDGVNASMITAAVVLNEDGSTRSVPMKIVTRDGKSYAVINSLTNSTYALVTHPVEFSDVANHWAKDAINDMGSHMIVNGTGNGMFSPDRDITRAEFASIIVRALGLKLEDGTSAFSDVEASAWYNRAVNTAYASHLINGFEDGTFRPNDHITREQAMVIIAKAMEITQLEGLTSEQTAGSILQPFTDAEEVSSWAKDGVAESVQAGIVSGRESKILAPKDFITRAEVATIMKGLLEKSGLI